MYGRLLLYVLTGVEVPVLANERLFTKVYFQRDEGLKAATRSLSRPKNFQTLTQVQIGIICAMAGEFFMYESFFENKERNC